MKLLERKNCPICRSLSAHLLYKLSYKDAKLKKFLKVYYNNRLPVNLVSKYDYKLMECKYCKLIFQKFVPDKNFMIELYEKFISSKESLIKKKKNIINLKKKYHNELNLVKKILNDNVKVLEFGAGWGFWSYEAKKYGLDVSCLELSKKKINFMKNKNLNVIRNLKNKLNKYDFIYSDQVFEHISNPKETLELLELSLTKNGYILLNFPSRFGFKSKVSNNYLPKKDAAHPLEHINLFNRSSLKFLIKNTNLKIINFRSLYFFNLKNLYKDLKNIFYFDSVLLKKNN
jgi:2-polyprenyl-3-methyl-5-hydroxy-6-metoxy-1,4-benzoquinol methylase